MRGVSFFFFWGGGGGGGLILLYLHNLFKILGAYSVRMYIKYFENRPNIQLKIK